MECPIGLEPTRVPFAALRGRASGPTRIGQGGLVTTRALRIAFGSRRATPADVPEDPRPGTRAGLRTREVVECPIGFEPRHSLGSCGVDSVPRWFPAVPDSGAPGLETIARRDRKWLAIHEKAFPGSAEPIRARAENLGGCPARAPCPGSHGLSRTRQILPDCGTSTVVARSTGRSLGLYRKPSVVLRNPGRHAKSTYRASALPRTVLTHRLQDRPRLSSVLRVRVLSQQPDACPSARIVTSTSRGRGWLGGRSSNRLACSCP